MSNMHQIAPMRLSLLWGARLDNFGVTQAKRKELLGARSGL
jgi:hypothetical protein